MERAYVGIGANLGQREATIERALELLAAEAGITVLRRSSLRETEPWGPVPQPRYINCAALLETELEPEALLAAFLRIERELGRVRGGDRYGPRTIDLDLLLYGDQTVSLPGLEVPHPRIRERAFVLEPLHELDPFLVVPAQGLVSELLAAVDSTE